MSSTSLKSSNITILANKPTAKANAKILAPKPTRSKGVFKATQNHQKETK